MKLVIPSCSNCKKKIILDSCELTRSAFREKHGHYFSATCAQCGTVHTYTANDIKAEGGNSGAVPASGAVIGGLIGLLAGPLGAVIGALLGGSIGTGVAVSESSEITKFNNS